jgi:peptidoglycan/xylan/chitin deacetylase (PgdA/CDA1 family)
MKVDRATVRREIIAGDSALSRQQSCVTSKAMSERLPTCFDSVEPFREFFQTGTPVLMYHKVAKRPRGVRLRGLYVNPEQFERHVQELKNAGFTTAALSELTSATVALSNKVVFTFDSGFRSVLDNGLRPLCNAGFRAIQFLVPNFLGKFNEWELRDGEVPEPLMDAFQVREWLSAGHEIGSQSMTHASLTRLSVRDAREEIFSSKKKLEDMFAAPVIHFCYPYGNWNDAIRDVVIEAGYQSACTTRFGVNTPETPKHAIHRIAARHPTRSLKALKQRLFNSAS